MNLALERNEKREERTACRRRRRTARRLLSRDRRERIFLAEREKSPKRLSSLSSDADLTLPLSMWNLLRMERGMDRRTFSRTIGLGVGAACFSAPLAEAAPKRRLKVGYTSITWGFRPEHAEPGIRDSARLGYHGYESLRSEEHTSELQSR